MADDDPFAELDDLLGQIEQNKMKSTGSSSSSIPTPPPQSSSSSTPVTINKTNSSSSLHSNSNNNSNSSPVAKSADLDNLLSEIANMEIKPVVKNNANTKTASNTSNSTSSPSPVLTPSKSTPHVAKTVHQPESNTNSSSSSSQSPSLGTSKSTTSVKDAAKAFSQPNANQNPNYQGPSHHQTQHQKQQQQLKQPEQETTTQHFNAPVRTRSGSQSYSSPDQSPSMTALLSPVSSDIIMLEGKYSLNTEESKLAREINRARTHPKEYAQLLLKERRPNFDGKNLKIHGTNSMLQTEEGVSAVDEAINFLNNAPLLPEFKVSIGMTKAAKEAVSEIGGKGEFMASKSIDKLDDYGRFEVEAVELVSFGTNDSKEVVLRFLVGDGNKERTHRNHIFNSDYKCIGVAVGAHNSSYKMMACVNFANNFREN